MEWGPQIEVVPVPGLPSYLTRQTDADFIVVIDARTLVELQTTNPSTPSMLPAAEMFEESQAI